MKIGRNSINGYLDSGKLPNADDSSIDTGMVAWDKLQHKINKSVNAGQLFSNGIVSTYS